MVFKYPVGISAGLVFRGYRWEAILFTDDNETGTGIPASEYAELLGKRIMQDCPSNEMLQMDWFQNRVHQR